MAMHDVAVELFYSGAWHDHAATNEVYTGDADHGDDIKITHGGGAETGGITPSTATLVFRSWRFNPDNVISDLYGLIGRNTPIRITVDGDIRFQGEVSSWTPQQSLGGDIQVPDRWVNVIAGGELRRIEAGTDPLPSSLKTFYLDASAAPVAYWPLDSGQLSLVGLPSIGAAPFNRSDGGARFAGNDMAPWLEAAVEIGDGTALSSMAGNVAMSRTPTRWAADHMRRNAGDARGLDFQVIGNSESAGGDRFDWVLDFNPSTSQLRVFQLLISETQSSVLLDTVTDATMFDDLPHHYRLQLNQDGADIDWEVTMDGDSLASGTVAASTLQGVGAVRLNSFTDPATNAAAISHIAVFEGVPPLLADTVEAAFGYAGETAGDRFVRLCGESDITDTVTGTAADTVHMGPQFPGTLAAQLEEIASTDAGTVSDTVDGEGVTYKTGRDRWNQDVALTLDYAAFEIAPPLQPVLDDKAIRNDVTAERRGGAQARAVDETSVAAVGRYTGKPDVNVFSDLVVDASAGWALHVGTTSSTRFNQVTVDLDACPALQPAVVAVRAGDRIALANLPVELTADPASLLVNGWAEVVAPDRRKITFNCVPEAAFHVAELEHDDYAIIDADDGKTTVRTAFNTATDTTLQVQNNYGTFLGYWSTSSMPFDILVAGARLTVTGAVSDGDPNFHFNVAKGPVNGAIKTIPVGSTVNVFHASYIGL